MQKFVITGGKPLSGEVRIAGAKNAVLKMMAASVLTEDECVLRNVPRISDVAILREVLTNIGFEVRRVNGDALELRAGEAEWPFVPLEAAIKMRASFILLGPMLARFGKVILPNPGGDRIGRRPVDYHVTAMERMGATITYRNGYYFAAAPPGGLRGAQVDFPVVSVMGTENAMMAATLAHGITVIDNAALEPEVDDLIGMLCAMGARIERTAERRIEIEGVDRLSGAEHVVLGDRLEAETFAIAAAITRGEVTLRGVEPVHLGAFLEVCDRMGVAYETDAANASITIRAADGQALRAIDVRTDPYPGFATDFQAPLSILMTQADGVSTIHETIFEDRLDHLRELTRMGAEIELVDERHAQITGPTQLHGAEVGIADLRAGATLILAALTATGTSVISGIEHVDRGYEQIEAKLVALGARINRIEA
ncbi:MAG: UDP-N-acetylglucosamine 1-carboxyvinyltransferase [Chloroflexota bacterium]|jgi:UDP-N-acetylglucosamine 1-carboxyvinyltransferase|nr:UDP-N-acetylglucosamine 1-carboxyvinyltransferase [Chloroflexota bacterium]